MLCNYHLGNGCYIEPDGFLPWKAYRSSLSLWRRALLAEGQLTSDLSSENLSETAPPTTESPAPAPSSLLVSGD